MFKVPRFLYQVIKPRETNLYLLEKLVFTLS